MSCRPVLMITRDGSKVESKLFNRLYDMYNDSEVALREYAYIHTAEFKADYTDWTSADFDPNLLDGNGELSKYLDPSLNDPKTAVELDPKFQVIVNTLRKRVNTLSQRMDIKKTDTAANAARDAVIADLKEQIAVIYSNASVDTVSKIALKQLEMAQSIFFKEDHTYGELIEGIRIVDIWSNIRSLLYDVDVEDVASIVETVEASVNRLKNISMQKSKALIESSDKFVTAKNLEIVNEIGTFFGHTLDASRSPDALVQSIDRTLKEASNKVEREKKEDERRLVEERKALETYAKRIGKTLGHVYEKFFQKEDGKTTFGFVGEHSRAYSNEVARQDAMLKHNLAEADTTLLGTERDTAKKKAYKNYYKWLSKNTIELDTSIFFGEHYKEDTTKDEEARIVAELGQASFDSLHAKAKVLYDAYSEAKDVYEASIEDEADKDNLLNNWIAENSPDRYFYEKKGLLFGPTYMNKKGRNYATSAPLRSVEKGKWYDTDFENIQNTPELKRYHDFVTSFLTEKLGYMPSYQTEDLQDNFLPVVQKDFFEKAASEGWLAAIKAAPDYLAEALTVDPHSTLAYGEHEDGKPIKAIPVAFLHESKASRLNNGINRSRDITKILEVFGGMSDNFKYMSNIQDEIVIKQLIAKARKAQVIQGGVPLMENGQPVFTSDGGYNTMKQLNYAIDAHLFGRRKEVEGVSENKISTLNLAEAKRRQERALAIGQEIKDLDNSLSGGNMTPEEYNTAKDVLDTELESISGKHLAFSKVADVSIQATLIKALGWNPFSAIGNLGFGVVSNYIHAAGGKDFTRKQLNKAHGILMNNTKTSASFDAFDNPTARKVRHLMDMLGVVATSEGQDGTRSAVKSKYAWASPHTMMRSGDFFIKGASTVAILMNTHINGVSGPTLWDAFDIQGDRLVWKEEYEGKEDWDPYTSDSNKFTDLSLKVGQVTKTIHGNFDKNSPVLLKNQAMGRLLSQFKLSWIAEGIANRLQDEQYNILMGRTTKGRYRTYQDVYMKEKGYLGGSISIMQTFLKLAIRDRNALAGLSPVDEENMRKNFASVAWGLSLSAIALALAHGLGDDDDDATKHGVRLLVNNLGRVSSDIWFYSNPTTFKNITANVIPAVSLYNDLFKASQGIAKYMTEKDFTGEQAILRWTKATPGLSIYNKTRYLAKQIAP